MRARLALCVSVAILAGALLPRASVAQIPIGGMSLSGDIVAGGLGYVEEPSRTRRGKFEEYRDVQDGLFLDRLDLHLTRPDESYAVDFGGSQWGHNDQSYYLDAGSVAGGSLGRWQFGFEWDELPHIYSTTGRTLATEIARGVWTLPAPRPSLPTWNAGRDLGEIGVRWDTAHVFLAVSPTPDLDLRADYTRIHKGGDRPFSVPFGSPGNNFLEILTPIEQTVQDVRVRATLVRDTWQIQAGYTFSMFHNDERSLQVDNPCFGLTAAVTAGGCGGDATGAPRTALVSLEPSNMAHTWNLGGGVSLPLRSRINVNATYSLRMQDESFLPHTINPALTSPLLTLPKNNLGGLVGTTLVNLTGTTHPLPPLTITLRYRFFDYNDMSGALNFPAHVVDDRGPIVIENRRAARFDNTRNNVDLDARYRFGQPLALTLGAGWEGLDRNASREVEHSNEVYAKAAVDATPWDWLMARLTYRPSFRRLDHYNTFARLEHTVIEEITPDAFRQNQSTLLRKFDEGDRDTQSLQLMVQVTPIETLSTSFTGEWRRDDYINSPLGLQDANRWSAGVDTTWRPSDRLAVFGGYVYELIFQKQRSRSRPVVGTTTFDFPDFDWVSDNTDIVHTFHLGGNVALIPGRLNWNTVATYSYALGTVDTRNPGGVTSTGAGAGAITTAKAKRFPAYEDGLFRIDSTLQYRFWKNWTASIGYAFESFEKHDWRTDTLNPFMGGITSIWLGNDSRNYSAHSLIAKIGVRF